MSVLYDKNEQTNGKWEAYCQELPDVRGIGDTPELALVDLTDKIRAIIKAVAEAQIRLCTTNGSLAESG